MEIYKGQRRSGWITSVRPFLFSQCLGSVWAEGQGKGEARESDEAKEESDKQVHQSLSLATCTHWQDWQDWGGESDVRSILVPVRPVVLVPPGPGCEVC